MENAGSASLVVKLNYDGTLRRITMPRVAEPSYSALEQKARELFNLQESAQIVLAYTDNDGDVITMVDDADVKDAIVLQKLNPLRVAVKVKRATPTIKDSINAIKDKSIKELMKEKPKRATAPLVLAPKEAPPAKEEAKSVAEPSVAPKVEETSKKEENIKAETPKEETPKVEETPKKEDIPKEETPKESPKLEVPPTEELKKIQREVKERLEAVLKGAAGDMEGLMASFAPFLQVAPAKLAEVMHLAMKSGLHASFEPQFEMNQPAPAPAQPAKTEAAAAGTFSASNGKEEASPEDPAPKEDAEDGGASNIFHTGVQCDVCGANPIVGPRYKSIVRINYDLCKACFAKEGVEGDYNKIERPLFRPRMHPFWGHGNGGPMPPRMGMRAAGAMGPHGPCFGGRPFYQGRGGGCGRYGEGRFNGDGKLDARFVKDVTIFDGTELAPGTQFTKIWRLRNSGSLAWPQHTQLVHVGGDHLGGSQAVALQLPEDGLAPGEEVNVSVDLVAPQNTGRYVSHWRMLAPGGPKFGHRVWALVQVVPMDEPSPQVAESVAAASGSSSSSEGKQPAAEVPSQVEPAPADKVVPQETVKEVPVNFIDLAPEEPAAPTAAPVAEVEFPVIAEPAAPESPKTEVTSVGGFSLVDRVPASSSSSASEASVEEQNTSFVMSAAPSAPKDGVTGEATAPPMTEEQHVPATSDGANMSQMLGQLESMGFTDAQLNESLLARNNMELQRTIDELVGANEWDHMMVELEEMGFYDKDVNRRLMFKNKGSMTRVVKELVENMKRTEQQ